MLSRVDQGNEAFQMQQQTEKKLAVLHIVQNRRRIKK